MKTLLLVLVVAAGASAFLIKVPTKPSSPIIAPIGWVHLQKLILPLFENVCEVSTNPLIVRLAQEFNIEASTAVYLKPDVLTNFNALKSKGLLPKGEIFSEYNIDHINELKIIYETLFYARDFDTFIKAAAWMRQNVNCGLFVDAIYLAVLTRRDTEKLSVPAPYELLPNYFITKDVIIQASDLLSGQDVTLSETVRDEGNAYILDANYTANFYDNDDESKLAYFHEDIGLNTFYFLNKLKKAPWFNTPPDAGVRYGEYLYHTMKQLSTRYNLERYSNGLPNIDNIDLDPMRITPYNPNLIYSNGNEFGQRTGLLQLATADINFLKNIEINIPTMVTHMMNTGYNKTQILNHLIEVLVTGENSYENIARRILGKEESSTVGQPSVLDHYLTSMRDPIFWKINQKIVDLIDNALTNIPGYMKNELYFPGVEILNIDVKKMMTSFDYFQFDVTDALKIEANDATFLVKIGQPRLNHKAFTLKLNISSLVTQKGLVKIYLGPKVAPGELTIKKNSFVLLDSFELNLKTGYNVLVRSSDEMDFSDDFNMLKTLKKNVEDAEFGLNALPLKPVEFITSFPKRLMLPKGTLEGLPLQIFVIIAPFVKATAGVPFGLSSLEFNTPILSPGYPFDLDVEDSLLHSLPNTFIKDFIITHKGDSKVANYGGQGVTKKWSGDTYNPSASTGGYGNKEPFDFESKRGQYGMKKDYSSKYGNKSKLDEKVNNVGVKTDEEIVKGPKYIVDDTDSNNIYTDDGKLIGRVELNRDIDVNPSVDLKPIGIIKDDIHDKSYVIEEIPELRPRNPSVYDYLLTDYYDVPKVYE